MLYLYRRLHVPSGGPGYHRGGQGLDFAWVPYNDDGLLGTVENACGQMPPHGSLGGYPGAVSLFRMTENFDAQEYIRARGRLPEPSEVTGYKTLRNHVASSRLPARGVFRQITGGGSGLGDPLLRPVGRVERDLRDGYITPAMADAAYGVVSSDGSIDVAATRRRRVEIRAERLGHPPAVTIEPPARFRTALEVRQDGGEPRVHCGLCGADLGPRGASLSGTGIVERARDLGEVMTEMGMLVQPLPGYQRRLTERVCGQCGTTLEITVEATDAAAGEGTEHVLTSTTPG
jgi:N-methylhydantoinase B